MDLSLMKSVRIKERLTFSFGANAYNIANHPNFDQPEADLANPNFGLITAEVAPPASILRAFVPGTAASPCFMKSKECSGSRATLHSTQISSWAGRVVAPPHRYAQPGGINLHRQPAKLAIVLLIDRHVADRILAAQLIFDVPINLA